jgi:hypothetical protein
MGMEISSDVFDDSDSIFEFAEDKGVQWEGREVVVKKFPAYANHLIKRIETKMQLIALDEKAFCQAAIHLARIGARSPEERALVERKIQHLIEEANNIYVVEVGFRKTVKHVWHKHKKAIIIGAVVTGLIIGAGVLIL